MPLATTAPKDELHGITNWKAGVWAGLIAGVIFIVLDMIMVRMFMGERPWAPPPIIAAMLLAQGVLPGYDSPPSFDVGIMVTALAIHFVLSVVYGLIVAWLVHRFDWGGGLLIGAAFGLAIYIINAYVIAPIAFAWFTLAQNWISAFAHIVFGLIAAVAYIGLRKPRHAGC